MSCLPLIDLADPAICNDEVADGTRDADADVIVSGREPGRHASRPGSLGWLLAGALAVALAVSDGLHRGGPPAASPARTVRPT